MNFYASPAYLEAAAEVYFNGRATAIGNVVCGDAVLRLLLVDGRPVTRLQFLDVHQPLAASEIEGPLRKTGYARQVVRGIIPCGETQPGAPLDLAPFVDWSGFASFETYKQWLLSRHKGLIKDRERRSRSLASNHGELVFTLDDTADDVLPLTKQWKSEQLRATGHFDFFSVPQTTEFLDALRARGVLVTSTLRAGGRLVSVWIGFIHEGVWSGWVFTYDPAFKKYSAGHQLLSHMLEESFRRGHREFDFSEGAEDYKLIYATHARLLGDAGRPPLSRALVQFTKTTLHAVSPKLFAAVRAMKRGTRPLVTSKPLAGG